MAKNIEINVKKEDGGYEVLYPRTLYENVGEGILLPEITVDTYNGAVVIGTNEDKTVSKVAENGKVIMNLPKYGLWNLSSTYGSFTGAERVNVDTVKQYNISIILNAPTLTITTSPGALVTINIGNQTLSQTAPDGEVVFKVAAFGTCMVTATLENRQGTGQIEISENSEYELTVMVPPVEYILSNLSWSEINYWVEAGYASSFTVGDYKELILNGSAGSLNFSNARAYVTIIGINHNTSKEGSNRLHFQLAFDNANTKLLGEASMNSSNSTQGGWNASQMRTRECANLISCLPNDLQSVVKTTVKYTSAGRGQNSEIVASSDKIFLLSEFEIFGSIFNSASDERNYQEQYSWYVSHNKVKYNFSNSANDWWTRSASVSNASYFCDVNREGEAILGAAGSKYGVAPCLCV